MKLYLVRHGRTKLNDKHITQGRIDSHLDNKGKKQAASIGNRLKVIDIDVIYTSPLLRAKETAEAISKYHDTVKFIVSDNLNDIAFGRWEGKTLDQIKKLYPEEFVKFHDEKTRANFRIQGGAERIKDVADRVYEFLQMLKLKYRDETIVIVTHAMVLNIIISKYLKLPKYELSRNHFQNTSLSIIDNDKIIKINDTGHLMFDR